MLLSCRTDHSPTHNPSVVFRQVIVFPSRFSSCVKDAAIMSSGSVQGETDFIIVSSSLEALFCFSTF